MFRNSKKKKKPTNLTHWSKKSSRKWTKEDFLKCPIAKCTHIAKSVPRIKFTVLDAFIRKDDKASNLMSEKEQQNKAQNIELKNNKEQKAME